MFTQNLLILIFLYILILLPLTTSSPSDPSQNIPPTPTTTTNSAKDIWGWSTLTNRPQLFSDDLSRIRSSSVTEPVEGTRLPGAVVTSSTSVGSLTTGSGVSGVASPGTGTGTAAVSPTTGGSGASRIGLEGRQAVVVGAAVLWYHWM